MPSPSTNYFYSLRLSQKLFILVMALSLLMNLPSLNKEIKQVSLLRKHLPYTLAGNKFTGLERIFKNVEMVGYYTDKSMDTNRYAMQFSQAQYALAPTILDLNNTDYSLILFDCTSPQVAINKMKEVGAIPLIKNPYGIILAYRKL